MVTLFLNPLISRVSMPSSRESVVTRDVVSEAISFLVVGIMFLTGCSTGSSNSQPAKASSEPTSSHVKWVKSYDTIEAIRADSTDRIVGHLEKSRQVVNAAEGGTGDGMSKSTIFHVRVDEVLAGSFLVGNIVNVRQLGTKETPAFSNEDLSLLAEGRSYVLFLQPFEFHRGVSTGQFQIVGEVGAFEVQGDTAVRTTNRDELAQSAALATVRRLAREH